MPQQNPSYDTTPFENGDRLNFSQTPEHMISPAEFNKREIEEATQRALALASNRGATSRYDTKPIGIAESAVEGLRVKTEISMEQLAKASAYIAAVRQQELDSAA